MNVQLISAGMGSTQWRLASLRLKRQALKSQWFSTVDAYDSTALQRLLPEFYTEHQDFLVQNSRGYGYWLWRPYLLLKRISMMKPNEVLLFLDAGCELNVTPSSQKRFYEYVDHAKREGMCLMRTPYKLTNWCKQDVLTQFKITKESDIRTVEPGVIFMIKNNENIELLQKWIEWCTKDNYHNLDDSPSIIPNSDNFIEHRHDQALLTALMIERSNCAIDQETFFPDNSWRVKGSKFPIWVVRNRYPFTYETGGIIARAYRFLRRVRHFFL